MAMEEGTNRLMENVMQYSAGGTIAAAAIGYRVLTSIVGDLGASSSPSTDSMDNDSHKEGASNSSTNMSSPKASHFLNTDWLSWGRRRSSSSTQYSVDKESSLRLFTLQEVSLHDSPLDCWVILYDRVYDITSFLDSHPGGDEVMMEYAGLDATLAFRSVGHSREAEESLKPYLIGILVESERIWTRFFNMKSDIP